MNSYLFVEILKAVYTFQSSELVFVFSVSFFHQHVEANLVVIVVVDV